MNTEFLVTDRELWACGRAIGHYRGTFPNGFLNRVDDRFGIEHRDVLFPFGGATESRDNWTVNDIRKGELTGPDNTPLKADTGHDATDLPDAWTDTFDVVLSDPPYAPHYAEDLYGTDYPKPSSHFREASRVCKPGGTVLVLDQLVYNLTWAADDHSLKRDDVIGVTTGPGMRIRALNVFHKPASLDNWNKNHD